MAWDRKFFGHRQGVIGAEQGLRQAHTDRRIATQP